MKKCRKCRSSNTSNVYRCINCGSPAFERKATGIILMIVAVYTLFSYFAIVFQPWKTTKSMSGDDTTVIIMSYFLHIILMLLSSLYSYRLWPSGYDWLSKLLGKKISEDKSATFTKPKDEKPPVSVPVFQTSQATKQCTECKSMNPEIAQFCYSCGAGLKKVQSVVETISPPKDETQEITDTCPSCGINQITSDQNFCFSCGHQINE